MRTENYYIDYRYVPGALYDRDMMRALVAGDLERVQDMLRFVDGGYGSANNGAIERKA